MTDAANEFHAHLERVTGELRDLRIARSAIEAEFSKLKRLVQEISDFTHERLETLVQQARAVLNESHCSRFIFDSQYAGRIAQEGNKAELGASIASLELAANTVLDSVIELKAYLRSALSFYRSS
jgi:hypothetical protein